MADTPTNKRPPHKSNRGATGKRPFNRERGDTRTSPPHPRGKNQHQSGSRPSGRSDQPERDHAPVIYGDEPKGIAVRRAAGDILALVREGMVLDDALRQCRSYQGLGRTTEGDKDAALTRADKGFARAMATIALRRRGTLDHLISPYLDRPLPPKAARVMDCLRLSAAQTLFLETPPHAAVSLATELTKERQETAGYANLVNAVARKLAGTPREKIAALPVRTDTPAWLWRSWERAYGAATARKIAAAHHHQAPLDITFARATHRDAVIAEASIPGASVFAYNEATTSLRLNPAPAQIPTLAGFETGQWWVQDLAASLPVTLLGDLTGKTVIDLCAAPGGKTMQLAAAGAQVIAIDRAEERLQRMRANLERTGLKATIITGDGLEYRPDDLVDIVLLDAPCTATGTVRRHPDIPWGKSDSDAGALAIVQARFIDHALTMIKPGGTLLYCTCSLQPEEGEEQITKALHRNPSLARRPFTAEDHPALRGPWGKTINRHGDIRITPALASTAGSMDGFFISRLTKNP